MLKPRVEVAKAFSAPIALLCLAQVPGGPSDFEGAWGLVLGALCLLQGTFNTGCLRAKGRLHARVLCGRERAAVTGAASMVSRRDAGVVFWEGNGTPKS